MSNQVNCALCGNKYEKTEDGVEVACPLCGGSGNQRLAGGAGDAVTGVGRLRGETTGALEDQLKVLSARIASDPLRFDEIRAELAFRRRTKDDQPAPRLITVEGSKREDQDKAARTNEALMLKITVMEAEQAKLVIEAELAKAAQREAEERLAIVARTTASSNDTLASQRRDLARALDIDDRVSWSDMINNVTELMLPQDLAKLTLLAADLKRTAAEASDSWETATTESRFALRLIADYKLDRVSKGAPPAKPEPLPPNVAALISDLRSAATETVVVGAATADPESRFALRLLRDHGIEY